MPAIGKVYQDKQSQGLIVLTVTADDSLADARQFAQAICLIVNTIDEIHHRALHAHPDDSLLLTDLLRLPELFPFHLTLDIDALRNAPWFSLYREANWVRVALRQSG